MKTIEVKVYTFEELSEEAKQVAIENYRNAGIDYSGQRENQETLDKFMTLFSLENYGRTVTDITVTFGKAVRDLSGWRLSTFLWNNYRKELFPGKYYGHLSKKEADGTPITVSKEHPGGVRHVKRHSKIILEHSCVFTGYYMDDEILEPIYKFMEAPDNTTFEDLLQDCVNSFEKSVEKDEDWQNSEEYISEQLIGNEYEFTEDGKRF